MSNPSSRIGVRGMTAKPESSFFRQLQTSRHRLQGVQYNVPEYLPDLCFASIYIVPDRYVPFYFYIFGPVRSEADRLYYVIEYLPHFDARTIR